MSGRLAAVLAAALLLGGGAGCRRDQGEGQLHARQKVLEREAQGLRETVAKLERGEPILPEDAVVVAVAESVVKEFLDAQLPFEVETGQFNVKLTQGEAVFRGSPGVRLTGSIWPTGHPDLVGEVGAQGALEELQVEPETGILRARLALDHVDLVKMGGLEKFIARGSLNELARTVRQQLQPHLPTIQIPVKIDQGIELPSLTTGPVLLQGARMPLHVSVADVFAGRGVLWVAIRVVPGELTKIGPTEAKTATAPPPTAPAAKPTATPTAKGGQR